MPLISEVRSGPDG